MNNSYYESKLTDYILSKQIPCEHLIFEKSCHSVSDAAEAAAADINEFVKNICFIDESSNRLIVAIVKGEHRVSSKKVAKVLEIEPNRLRTATPEEILTRSGYPCGGTPSFGYEANFIIDPKVLEQSHIYTGGGSANSLVKISPQILEQVNFGRIGKIRK